MFDPRSRYHEIPTAVLTLADGREIAYVRRRLVPPGRSLSPLGAETVAPSDRLDLIAARSLGDAEQFWLVCDANDALDPDDLLEPGRRLVIPMPQP